MTSNWNIIAKRLPIAEGIPLANIILTCTMLTGCFGMRQFLPPEIAAVKESCEHVVPLGEIKFNVTPSLCRTTVERFLPYYREKKEGKLGCKFDYTPYEIAEYVASGSMKGEFPIDTSQYIDKTGIHLKQEYQKAFNEEYDDSLCGL